MRVTDAIRRHVADEGGGEQEFAAALADLVDRIDVVMTQNARQKCSAADVTAMLFANDFGNMGVKELRAAGLLEGDY